ncbi:MAG: maleylpyruvate isomerase family mycothiol-dependent enzyme [Sciscionella sp.]
MLDVIYGDAQSRVGDLARGLTDAELDTVIPGCPEWSARDLIAHLTGVASDSLSGRGKGVRGPAWTAPQVAERRERSLEDVLAEWDELTPHVGAALAARAVSSRIVIDLVAHEADLYEALGRGRPPSAGWAEYVGLMATQVSQGLQGPGTLVLHVAGQSYRGGQGEPVTELRADPYELFRGLLSRRSRAQMRTWDWTGDPTPYLESLPVFGPRDDDQPVPS